MTAMTDLTGVAKHPDTCHQECVRRGELVPCEKPAVAVRIWEDDAYPVCGYHAVGGLVPLRELLAYRQEPT